MSGLNPQGPSQPPLNDVYSVQGNPATKEPAEKVQADRNANSSAPTVDQRIPEQQSTFSDATFSSLGSGIRAPAPGEDPSTLTRQDAGLSQEVTAEQMHAPGEGEIASAVDGKPGAGGAGQVGLEKDLESKKAEQAPARAAQKATEAEEVDVAGVLGQRGGPANPVDKGGYPNAGSMGS